MNREHMTRPVPLRRVAMLGFAAISVAAAIGFGSALADDPVDTEVGGEVGEALQYTEDVRQTDQWAAIVAIGDQVTGTPTSYNEEGIYNPHHNHRSDEACSNCHMAGPDRENVLSCTECHEIVLPDGWISFYDVEQTAAESE